MIRNVSILLLMAGLSAVVGAQGPRTGLTAAQQQLLFQRNRTMIQTLVDSTIDMSADSGDYLKQAKTYKKVIVEFQRELGSAADSSDAKRIAELGNHLDTLMRQGMAPSLKAAHQQIGGPKGSGYKDLLELRDNTVNLVDWLQDKARNQWADTPEVREVIEKLERSKKELGNAVAP